MFTQKSIELLPAYFILAEANIGMGGAKLKKAEEFLIAANWNLLKSGNGGDDGAGEQFHQDCVVTGVTSGPGSAAAPVPPDSQLHLR